MQTPDCSGKKMPDQQQVGPAFCLKEKCGSIILPAPLPELEQEPLPVAQLPEPALEQLEQELQLPGPVQAPLLEQAPHFLQPLFPQSFGSLPTMPD